MENAVDALKIAFAIIIFVIAITITFAFISQAKSTADVVLYHSDRTNYYEYAENSSTNRTVTLAEVISTLYRYNKETLCVEFQLKNGTYRFDLANGKNIVNNKDIEQELINFLEEPLSNLGETKFTEEFAELPISGIYNEGEDGSVIALSSGKNKVYIKYTEV